MQRQQQQIGTLEFWFQEQRARRQIKNLYKGLLVIVWAMGAFIIIGRYLALEKLRSSDVIDAMITIIPSLFIVAFFPGMLNRKLRQERLVANEEGIHLQNSLMKFPPIPWNEIRELRPRRFLGMEVLIVVPQSSALLKKRLGWWKWFNARWPGGIGLPVTRLGTARDMVEQLNSYRSANGL